MPGSAARRDQSKFARYRASHQAKGLRLLRMWVPDSRAPGFAVEATRQARLINGAPDRDEVLAFIEAAAAWPRDDYDRGGEPPPARADQDPSAP